MNGGGVVVHKGAALELSGTENAMVSGCTFRNLGGNAILISDYRLLILSYFPGTAYLFLCQIFRTFFNMKN